LPACGTSTRMEIDYKNPGRTPMQRRVDPYHGVRFEGDWYVVGFCHLRGAVRTFSLARMTAVRKMEERIYCTRTDFDFGKLCGSQFRRALGGERRLWCGFCLTRGVADYVRERRWHPSQSMEEPCRRLTDPDSDRQPPARTETMDSLLGRRGAGAGAARFWPTPSAGQRSAWPELAAIVIRVREPRYGRGVVICYSGSGIGGFEAIFTATRVISSSWGCEPLNCSISWVMACSSCGGGNCAMHSASRSLIRLLAELFPLRVFYFPGAVTADEDDQFLRTRQPECWRYRDTRAIKTEDQAFPSQLAVLVQTGIIQKRRIMSGPDPLQLPPGGINAQVDEERQNLPTGLYPHRAGG
jgi:hypothetical protein